jgi:hypothetical protein
MAPTSSGSGAEQLGRCLGTLAEQAFLYDIRACSSRQVPMEHIRERKPRRAAEIAVIIDLIYYDADGVPHVRDWKTGWRAAAEPAADSTQLRLCGLAAARAFGWPRVVVEMAHVSEDGVEIDPFEMSAFDLDAEAGALLAMLDEMRQPQQPRPGPHCNSMYCPIVASCPSTKAALAQVDPAPLALPLSVEITSAEHCASVRQRRKAVEAALERIKEAEHAYVLAHGPVEVAPGVLYGARERLGRETIDVEASGAMAAIRAALGSDEAADAAVEVSASKASIARGVAKAVEGAGRGAKAAKEREVMARLRELGAIRTGAPYTVFEEWTAKEDET